MTKSIAQQLTALITDRAFLLEVANAAEKAYADATGGAFTPITEDKLDAIQNNIPVGRAVLNGSLALVILRGHEGDKARRKALQDIAGWESLTDDEKMVVRLFTNATWWVRNANRDIARTTRGICMDYAELLAVPADENDEQREKRELEIKKDDVLLQAVAKVTLSKLS